MHPYTRRRVNKNTDNHTLKDFAMSASHEKRYQILVETDSASNCMLDEDGLAKQIVEQVIPAIKDNGL